jgi:hypothetical protein
MADTNRNPDPTADELDEGTPIMQQVLDNPFLLLFLGIAMPTVLYIVRQPLHRLEGSWIVLSLIWRLIMFFMMPYWHIYGKQNLANEAYGTTPDAYTKKSQAVVDQYTARKDTAQDIPVVQPPAERR